MNTIDTTLAERGSRYGEYDQHAQITQDLKKVMHNTMNWTTLQPHQKETLEMVAHKIGRILNGDPMYHDSWWDIVGYTKLTADYLLPKTTVPVVATLAKQKR
jgi:hypothetical protein